MESLGGSQSSSGSEDEPLVPEEIHEEFLATLVAKVPEITKALRQKDTHDNADNVQRLLICLNRYKADYLREELRSQELAGEVCQLQERLENAAQMSRMDQSAMSELRSVIESAWKQKDAAQNREQIAQDEMMRLREKVELLEQTVQRLSDKSSLLQIKSEGSEELTKFNEEIKDLQKRLQIQRSYTTEVETMTKTLEEKNKALIRLLDESSAEAYNNRKRIDILQKELETAKSNVVRYIEEIAEMKTTNEQLTKLKVQQNLQTLSLKTNLEQINSQYNATANRLAKLTVDLEYAVQQRDKNKRDLVQKANLLKSREEELIKLKQENSKLAKAQDNTERKYVSLEEAKLKTDEENTRLKIQLNTQDKEVASMRRLVHQLEGNNVSVIKERDTLKRDLLQQQHTTEETNESFRKSQHEIRSLKDSLRNSELKEQKLKENLKKLSKTKEKVLEEIQMLEDKIESLQDEIHLKENHEIELKRTINDIAGKCAKFQAQHDALIRERSDLQRSLQAEQEENIKLKQTITTLQNDIEQHKDVITHRTGEISKLQSQLDRMEKEKRMLRTELRKARLTHQHTRAELTEKRRENDRHSKSLQENELNISRLKRELDVIINEKHAVSAQLTKRNDDYVQLKEKFDNLQTAADLMQKQLSQDKNDIRLLSAEIKNLRTERNVLRKDRESAADLRHELLQMHRLLNQERVKARALLEEMVTPMNVHRWRNLCGKDPEKMELLQRLQALRKQILSQNVVALEQERALAESQHVYAALKEFMLKLPSHTIKDELNKVKRLLFRKDKKLKAVLAELEASRADEKTKDSKLEDLKAQLANAKLQLTEEKKKKQKLLEERRTREQIQEQYFSAPPSMQHNSDAGFNRLYDQR